MTTIKARFDGSVFVPDEPVNLPIGYGVEIPIDSLVSPSNSKPPLVGLMELLDELPDDPDWPADGAAQHDHYLYGTPKRT